MRTQTLLIVLFLSLGAWRLLPAQETILPAASVKSAVPAPSPAPPQPIHIVLDGARKAGDCVTEGSIVQHEVQTLPFPPGWTIAIMCTPVRWETLLQQADPGKTHAAFTRLGERITVLNGDIFHDFPLRYRHIMAHELGHIQCGCADEARAEKLAEQLEKGSSPPARAASAAGK